MKANNDGSTATNKYTATEDHINEDSANYKTIFIANGFLSFADGLYRPFFLGFLHRLGDIPLLGAGLGLLLIFESVGLYITGKLADKYGRRPFFLITPVFGIALYFAYPLLPLLEEIDRSLMFFALHLTLIINGIVEGAWSSVEAAYLGDITTRTSRGSKMGSYWGVAGFITGAAMLVAGFLGIYVDFLTATFIVVFIYSSGFLMLFRITETKRAD